MLENPSGKANFSVIKWASIIPPEMLYLSVITVVELEIDVLSMARRDRHQGIVLRRWLEAQVLPVFDGRILNVDIAVARKCAELHVPDKRAERDAMIAATALIHRIKVVTRNTADFDQSAIELVNP